MNLPKYIVRSGVSLMCLAALLAQAQTSFYKANNNDSLDLGTSWVGGTAPASTATDIAIWDKYPLSSYALADKVLIDGDVYFDKSLPGYGMPQYTEGK